MDKYVEKEAKYEENSDRSNSSMENAHGSKVGKLSVDTEVSLGDT